MKLIKFILIVFILTFLNITCSKNEIIDAATEVNDIYFENNVVVVNNIVHFKDLSTF